MSLSGREVRPPEYDDPLQGFRELMPRRVRRMLLVGSRYDFFVLWEDGQLSQLLLSEWLHAHLSNTKWITLALSGAEALGACREEELDLVIVTPHIRDMDALELGRQLRAAHPELPVVPLAFDSQELAAFRSQPDIARFERPFLWQGDFRLLLGIVQSLEDRWNVAPDTASVGVSVIILIEDSVHYYSSYLPMIYETLRRQSQRVIAEGTSLHHKIMRLRARPKILHCTTYEEALGHFRTQRAHLLGIISDVKFPRGGVEDRDAGLDFARMVRAEMPDLPILLQTKEPALRRQAEEIKAAMVLKGSPTVLEELGQFMRGSFGFGSFVFVEDGQKIAEAEDLRQLEQLLQIVPLDVVLRHAESNHFSTWLKARTEFGLAETLRDAQVSDFPTGEAVRDYLVTSLREFRHGRQSGSIADFDPAEFNPTMSFARIGEGSLGGKARGLGFVRTLLHRYQVRKRFPEVEIQVPAAVVLATHVFDQFLEENGLREFAMEEQDDAAIERRFIEARLPADVFRQLTQFLDLVDYPLAVRSSSLLEDSQNFSLTGVYRTYMVPNSHPDREVRLKQVVNAVKRVYASTFFQNVKSCFRPAPYRLEEEKMAVIIQRVVGSRHGNRFYPDFSGTVRSHNFYPTPPLKHEDGIARLALGLGEEVVSGEKAVSFSPKYPQHPIQFSTPAQILENSQTEFFALELEGPESRPDPAAELKLARLGLAAAIEDDMLAWSGSVYSPENDAVYDGVGRPGVPLVTFFPVLKQGLFPLAEILRVLMDVGARAMNMPVEIEFAANLSPPPGQKREVAFLQLRPFTIASRPENLVLDDLDVARVLCASTLVLGHGVVDDVRDIVVVDRDRFDRSHSLVAAQEVADLNARLVSAGTRYLLIGVGRWGSADPWLGIPIAWPQINGARVIVESDFKDMHTTPSQGSHFFQNLTTSGTGYFTVGGANQVGYVDWEWLAARPAEVELTFVRHLRLEKPLRIVMDGHKGHGVIEKP